MAWVKLGGVMGKAMEGGARGRTKGRHLALGPPVTSQHAAAPRPDPCRACLARAQSSDDESTTAPTTPTPAAAQWTGSNMAVTPVRDQTRGAHCAEADPGPVAVQVLRRVAGEACRRRERVSRRGMPPEPTSNKALLTHRSPGTLPASSPAPRASSSGAPMASSASCRRPSRSCAPSTPTT